MVSTKKVGTDLVAVSFGADNIYIRKSGKENFNKEEQLIKIDNGNLYIDKAVAEKYNIKIRERG